MAGWMTAGLGTTEKLAAPARYRRSIARAGTLTRSPYPRPAEVTALQVRTATSKRASLHNVICTHINAAAIAHRTKDEIRKVGVMIEEAWMMLDRQDLACTDLLHATYACDSKCRAWLVHCLTRIGFPLLYLDRSATMRLSIAVLVLAACVVYVSAVPTFPWSQLEATPRAELDASVIDAPIVPTQYGPVQGFATAQYVAVGSILCVGETGSRAQSHVAVCLVPDTRLGWACPSLQPLAVPTVSCRRSPPNRGLRRSMPRGGVRAATRPTTMPMCRRC